MQSTTVESTTLVSILYDEVSRLLQLEFPSRIVYQYFNVPASVHGDLLNSPSKGAFFNQAIRGRYTFSRVTERNR